MKTRESSKSDKKPAARRSGGGSKSSKGLGAKKQQVKAGILKAYYGNPMKDMKLIAITGATGKTTVAHYMHEILKAAHEQVAVLASDQPFKIGMLHKFLSDAWKAGANVVIVTVPAAVLRDNVFYGLPVHVAAMTNFVTAGLSDMTADEFIDSEKTLFDMKPDYVVMNHDDLNYDKFAEFQGVSGTLDYGQTGKDVRVLSSKLYPRGTEATVSLKSDIINVASFLTGETTVAYMACAIAIAEAMKVSSENIIEGLAEWEG